jgi:transposase
LSVLSALRDRLLAGRAEALRLDQRLERWRTRGWLKARGPQRPDSPHVLAALRVMNRLALVAVAPAWLPERAPLAWDERYGTRIEETRLPPGQASRDA